MKKILLLILCLSTYTYPAALTKQRTANTMQLFKAVMNSQEDALSNLLEEQQALNINAQWPVANNITPLEIALNKAIKSAKEYYEVVESTHSKRKILTGVMIGGGLVAALSGTLSSYGFNVLSDHYCTWGAYAGLSAVGAGALFYPGATITNYFHSMQRKLAIVQILLNNKDIDLTATQLNMNDAVVHKNLNSIKTISPQENLDQFVADAHRGKYDNLIFKAQ